MAPPASGAAAATVDWKTATELSKVDFSGLTPEQKEVALGILRETPCACGCGMMIAECRVKDQSCPQSPGMAAYVVTLVKEGKDRDTVIARLKPPPPQAPQAPPPALSDKQVQIPIDTAPAKGAKKAKVTIVEFSDFQCPWCVRAVPWVEEMLKAYPKDLRVVFKHYPLAMHPQAKLAATAALAAQQQGKFWEMHDKLFANARTLSRENMVQWASEIGLDTKKFEAALDSSDLVKRVETDMSNGTEAGVTGTPAFFVNGRLYQGARTLDAIRPIIDAQLK